MSSFLETIGGLIMVAVAGVRGAYRLLRKPFSTR